MCIRFFTDKPPTKRHGDGFHLSNALHIQPQHYGDLANDIESLVDNAWKEKGMCNELYKQASLGGTQKLRYTFR